MNWCTYCGRAPARYTDGWCGYCDQSMRWETRPYQRIGGVIYMRLERVYPVKTAEETKP